MRTISLTLLACCSLTILSCRAASPASTQPLSAEEREQRLTDARWNMIGLAGSFNAYNLNHDGLPTADTWQQSLINDGLRTPKDLVSPASDGDSVEYVLVPAAEFSWDREQMLVYEDPDHHAGQVVVMFHDGHVESISRGRFEELARRQGIEIEH